ncbi:MAG: hypothetical protein L0Y58_21575 [Verrucomicrobia subdivision 3 bacterium]|nr:hypothetical protein [Limisphaerales bacterium]
MALTPVDPRRLRQGMHILLGISIIAAAIHFPFRESIYIRGPFGALGLLCAWLALGTALWTAIRLRDKAILKTLLISLFVFAYWAWQLYDAVIGRYQ